jgi:abortive infection bacteriophage resistance protein
MKYEKKPITIEQQIELLESRGLIIEDESRLGDYLKDISYYHLSAYFKFYQKDDDNFLSNTSFDDVLRIYLFDNKLRPLLLGLLERIEQSFKCRMAYELSILKNDAYWFEDEAIFSSKDEHAEILKILKEEVEKSKDELSVKHYFEKYGEPSLPPIWILTEILSFGECVKIYRKLIISYRNKVARTYGEDEKFIINWVHCLSILRNICAHHSRLWNREIVLTPNKNHRKYQDYFTDSNRLFNYLVILQILLGKINPNSSWVDRLDKLVIECQINVSHMGFPKDWKEKLNNIKTL